MAVVDIVGHFGTTFSYATVGSCVARALRDRGLLGIVMNLDAEWHPSFSDLGERRGDRGSHVLLFTPPYHYVDVFASQYGRNRSAIYMSPNTDALADEHAMTCAKFGWSIAPSEWCERVVRFHVPDAQVMLLPLGVDRSLADTRDGRQGALLERLLLQQPKSERRPARVLHFSTDQSWPGRKGTEELIIAWAMLVHGPWDGETQHRLVIHLPPALKRYAAVRARELEVDGSVVLVSGRERGALGGDLADHLDNADLVVAPSRCEGFGMMFLASLVAGVPLLCTYNTGHRDFLADNPGWLGVPTPDAAAMAGEEGLAPLVEPKVLAQSLLVAIQPQSRLAMLKASRKWIGHDPLWGTWEGALPKWGEQIEEWTEETCRTR